MTPDPREEACNRFIDGEGLAYIKAEDIDGTRTCILFDGDGEKLASSEYGMIPLFTYAMDLGITICAVH